MKRGMLPGVVLAISNVFSAPAQAQECGTIMQELDAVSTTVSREASAYWRTRTNYIEYKSAAVSAPDDAQKRFTDAAKTRALGAKTAMAQAFARFAVLANTAQSLKCQPEDELQRRRERIFNHARSVNFDQLPAEITTEGAPPRRRP